MTIDNDIDIEDDGDKAPQQEQEQQQQCLECWRPAAHVCAPAPMHRETSSSEAERLDSEAYVAVVAQVTVTGFFHKFHECVFHTKIGVAFSSW